MGGKKEYGCGKTFIYFFKFFSFNSFNPYRHGLNQVRMKQTVRSKVILSWSTCKTKSISSIDNFLNLL